MRDITRHTLILSGILTLIAAAFFIYSFLHWLNYDSTAQANLCSVLPTHDNVDLPMNQADKFQVDQVAIEYNPFIPFRRSVQEPDTLPELCFNGLILGERRLAILEEIGPPYRSWIVQEGDGIFGAQVIRIGRQQVELSRDGRSIILKTQEEPTP